MKLLNFFFSMGKAREIGSLTDFLVGNPAFRYLAMSAHEQKKSVANKMEAYLDKELLGQE